MSSSVRTILLNPRPLRSLVATSRASRAYATVPTKNLTPSPPKDDSKEQAMPLGRFYEAILNTPQPIPDVKPEEPASSVKAAQQEAAPEQDSSNEPAKRGRKPKAKADSVSAPPSIGTPPSRPSPASAELSGREKAKLVFASPLAGPAERAEKLAQLREKGKVIAGVLVPPKPEEPDNCCMSGCVNCVWDRYREEMEEWVLVNAEATTRLAALKAAKAKTGADVDADSDATLRPTPNPITVNNAISMEDDGGGSETNWDLPPAAVSSKITKDFWDDDLYKNLPVGIREFMKQEKKLKEKQERNRTLGG